MLASIRLSRSESRPFNLDPPSGSLFRSQFWLGSSLNCVGILLAENFSLCLGVFVVRLMHHDFTTEAKAQRREK